MKTIFLTGFFFVFTLANAQNKSNPELPPPYATQSVMNFCKVIGWPEGKTPVAPDGFTVTRYTEKLKSPRWMYVAPNGDVLVALSNTETKGIMKVGAVIVGMNKSGHTGESANAIVLLRDADKNGIPEIRETFLDELNQPIGMLILGNWFYVANTDGLWRFPYKSGDTHIDGEGKMIYSIPGGERHWTRNIIANADGSKIYISVGSATNVADDGMEKESHRADIIEINPDGTGERIYASGLRNPVGMAWAPGTKTLWAAVNERDELGDELVPDYITSVKENGFYGWPYSYYGQHLDPRIKQDQQRPELVSKAIVPDVNMGPHTACLGLAFYDKKAFPEEYHNGAFVGEHGSWNRSELNGYKVAFVPFHDGKPVGPPRDFLTGFIADKSKNEVYGRPVGVTVLPDGSVLVADDASDTIWVVRKK